MIAAAFLMSNMRWQRVPDRPKWENKTDKIAGWWLTCRTGMAPGLVALSGSHFGAPGSCRLERGWWSGTGTWSACPLAPTRSWGNSKPNTTFHEVHGVPVRVWQMWLWRRLNMATSARKKTEYGKYCCKEDWIWQLALGRLTMANTSVKKTECGN